MNTIEQINRNSHFQSTDQMPNHLHEGQENDILNEITLPAGLLDLERLAATFAVHGVVVLPEFFTSSEMAEVQADLDAWIQSPDAQEAKSAPGFDRHQTRSIGWLPIVEGCLSFEQLRDHPRMAAVTKAIIGNGAVDGACMIRLSRTGHQQAWHQDSNCEEPDQFLVNRLLYLWDVDPQSGSLMCVPGSHRAGRIPPGDPDGPIAGEVALAPRSGTLVLVHSRCYHRVTCNTTNQIRVSVNFRVSPSGVRDDVNRYGVYRTGTYDHYAKTNIEVPET